MCFNTALSLERNERECERVAARSLRSYNCIVMGLILSGQVTEGHSRLTCCLWPWH